MKTKLLFTASAILLAGSFYALAATDYTQIKKDVIVMAEIVKGAFKADPECKRCNVSIKGTYLAEQGVMFMIQGHSASHSFIHINDDHDYRYSYTFDDDTLESLEALEGLEGLEGLESLEQLPEMISGIMSGVSAGVAAASMSDSSDSSELELTHFIRVIESSTRESLREIRRERRDLQQEIRENQIELIHMDEADQKRLQENIKEMETAALELESRQMEIENKTRDSQREVTKQRDKQRQQKLAAQQAQQELIQSKVLEAFCDYGPTLRSLPSKEKITLIFENSNKEDTIMVFDQNEITACERGKEELKKKAIAYNF
jgi:hypothetical protein